MNREEYKDFIHEKSQLDGNFGFEPTWIPEFLFDFQKFLVRWAVLKGRAAIFADCGTGKSPMSLVWAQNVYIETGKPVLILTPLAVASQFVQEADKFGVGIELKPSYYRQAVKNVEDALNNQYSSLPLFGLASTEISI